MRREYRVDKLRVMGVEMGLQHLAPQTCTVLKILMMAKDPEHISEFEILALMNVNKDLLNTKEDHLMMWGRHRRRLIKEGILFQTKG